MKSCWKNDSWMNGCWIEGQAGTHSMESKGCVPDNEEASSRRVKVGSQDGKERTLDWMWTHSRAYWSPRRVVCPIPIRQVGATVASWVRERCDKAWVEMRSPNPNGRQEHESLDLAREQHGLLGEWGRETGLLPCGPSVWWGVSEGDSALSSIQGSMGKVSGMAPRVCHPHGRHLVTGRDCY